MRRKCGAKLRALRIKVKESYKRALADPSLRIGNRHNAALEVGDDCYYYYYYYYYYLSVGENADITRP